MKLRHSVISLVVAIALLAGTAHAATINVDTFADDVIANGNCTLREAIQAANSNIAVDTCASGQPGFDTVSLLSGTYLLDEVGASEDLNQTGDLDVTEDVQISGSGANLTTIDAGDLDRAFEIHSGTVGLAYMRITNGTAPSMGGGLVRATGGTLNIEQAKLDAGAAPSTCGGAVHVAGAATGTVQSTLFTGNSASSGGALCVLGVFNIQGSTISGNSASTEAGAIYSNVASPWTLTHVTVANNTSGGINGVHAASVGPTVISSIFQNISADCATIVDNGWNIFSEPCTGVGSYSIIGDAMLGPLAANGGPSETHTIAAASPAIDHAAWPCSPTDQRGTARPQGFRCDMGALERVAPPDCSTGWVMQASLGSWVGISPPCSMALQTPLSLFADDLTGGNYDSTWVLESWDPPASEYFRIPAASPMGPDGTGYWFRTDEAPGGGVVTMDGADLGGPVTVGLWPNAIGSMNMVGNPHAIAHPWPDMRFDYGTGPQTPGQAELDGRAGRFAWVWNGGSYQVFDPSVPGTEGMLWRGTAFWVNVYGPGPISLAVPAAGGLEVERGRTAPDAFTDGEWMVRLRVSQGALRDPGNLLGVRLDARFGFDRRDLPEPPPFGSRFLTLVFPHDETATGGMWVTGDFRPQPAAGRGDSWPFSVKASDPGNVKLTLEGPAEILACSSVVDAETGEWHPASAPIAYRQDAPEHRFVFHWMRPAPDARGDAANPD